MLWVVEGGCRFSEIDAVLREVRFFFLGIPFKSQPLHIGAIWDNVNIQLQYNFAGCSSLVTDRSSLPLQRFNVSPVRRLLANTFGVVLTKAKRCNGQAFNPWHANSSRHSLSVGGSLSTRRLDPPKLYAKPGRRRHGATT